jgi:hypothetical protein
MSEAVNKFRGMEVPAALVTIEFPGRPVGEVAPTLREWVSAEARGLDEREAAIAKRETALHDEGNRLASRARELDREAESRARALLESFDVDKRQSAQEAAAQAAKLEETRKKLRTEEESIAVFRRALQALGAQLEERGGELNRREQALLRREQCIDQREGALRIQQQALAELVERLDAHAMLASNGKSNLDPAVLEAINEATERLIAVI